MLIRTIFPVHSLGKLLEWPTARILQRTCDSESPSIGDQPTAIGGTLTSGAESSLNPSLTKELAPIFAEIAGTLELDARPSAGAKSPTAFLGFLVCSPSCCARFPNLALRIAPTAVGETGPSRVARVAQSREPASIAMHHANAIASVQVRYNDKAREFSRPLRSPGCAVSARGLHDGAVAQLGERRVRNAEVRGSTPLSSTNVY